MDKETDVKKKAPSFPLTFCAILDVMRLQKGKIVAKQNRIEAANRKANQAASRASQGSSMAATITGSAPSTPAMTIPVSYEVSRLATVR
jgi:hypothetical protein